MNTKHITKGQISQTLLAIRSHLTLWGCTITNQTSQGLSATNPNGTKGWYRVNQDGTISEKVEGQETYIYASIRQLEYAWEEGTDGMALPE